MTEAKDVKEPKPKQAKLPGFVPQRIAAINTCADTVKEFETQRLEAQEQEIKERARLKGLMKEHKLQHYALEDDMEVVLEASEEKAFVRRAKKSAAASKPKKEKSEKENAE